MTDLSDRLIERGLVTRGALDTARLEAAKIGRSVWFTLVKLEYLSEEAIVRFFAQEANIPYVRLSDYRIRQSALNILEENFCRQNMVIPLCISADTLFVACNNPFNSALLDTVGKLSRRLVEPLMATSSAINQALDYYWRLDNISFEAAKFLVRTEPVKGMMLWRESERISIDWPVSVKVTDEDVSLSASPCVSGRARDISRDCSAIGVVLALYIPRGIKVMVAIEPFACGNHEDKKSEAAGDVVHSYMLQTQDYSIGIRFGRMEQKVRDDLIRMASINKARA